MEKSEIIFLSHILTDTTVTYGDRDRFVNEPNTSFQKGDKAESSNWFFSSNHIGTHVDAPSHFVPGGRTVTDFDANYWVFKKASCIEIPSPDAVLIGIKDIEPCGIRPDVELLLIKTGYEKHRSQNKYWNENPGIAPELGDYLRHEFPFLRAIGFDFISMTSFQHRSLGKDAHLAFLDGEHPILPIEDMTLDKVNPSTGFKEVIVSPLRVFQSNGSPVTVFAEIFEDIIENPREINV